MNTAQYNIHLAASHQYIKIFAWYDVKYLHLLPVMHLLDVDSLNIAICSCVCLSACLFVVIVIVVGVFILRCCSTVVSWRVLAGIQI